MSTRSVEEEIQICSVMRFKTPAKIGHVQLWKPRAVWHISPNATVRCGVFSCRNPSDNVCLYSCHLGTLELGLLKKRDRHITETKRQNTRKSEREKDTRGETETDSLWTPVIGCLSKWPSEFTSHCDDCRWRIGKGRAIERWSSYSDWNVTRERTYANSDVLCI